MQLEAVGAEGLDRLSGLWRQLYEHHVGLDGDFQSVTEPRDGGQSWSVRRSFYEELLDERGGWITMAVESGEDVGYAAVAVRPGSSGSWTEPTRVAVLETLVVDRDRRSTGLGATLVDSVRAECRRRSLAQLDVEALTVNVAAIASTSSTGSGPS